MSGQNHTSPSKGKKLTVVDLFFCLHVNFGRKKIEDDGGSKKKTFGLKMFSQGYCCRGPFFVLALLRRREEIK